MDCILPVVSLRYEGEGQFQAPHPNAKKYCDKNLVIGQVYHVEVKQDRSAAYHRMFFAALREVWGNLPEPWDQLLPTPVHLRKYALIKAGWCDSQSIVAPSAKAAQEISIMAKWADEYCVTNVDSNVVTVFRARSQSFRAQDRKQFNEIAPKVLEIVSAMIGANSDTVITEAKRRAA